MKRQGRAKGVTIFAREDEKLVEDPWKHVELRWGIQAPRQRMARLLWQLLQDPDEQEFNRRFTLDINLLVKDAARCAEVLPPIQDKLKWVLEGSAVVDRETEQTGQAAWGETWYLPREQAAYVREQLRKAHPDLLEQESDYQDAVRFSLDFTVTHRCKVLSPPSHDPGRVYVGEILKDDDRRLYTLVWVEGIEGRHPLPNAAKPYTYRAGTNMTWGYTGSGPNNLALSILADAVDGDLELAQEHWLAFRDEVVAQLPQDEPIRITRASVLEWLQTRGIKPATLAARRPELEKRRVQYEPVLRRWAAILDRQLYAQRFDLVPADFECALYLDLVDMIQSGGRVLQCHRCGLPISFDGSPRSNRQRARWMKGEPIYHPWCFQEVMRERKRVSWVRWAQDPVNRAKRRQQARERRKVRQESSKT